MQKKRIAIFFILLLVFSYIFPLFQVNANSSSVRYQVHLKDLGWVNTVYDGQVGGTTGQSRRMEAIAIALNGVDGNLTYQVHVQDYGWLGKVSEGQIAGTTGQSRRMEAIIINLDNSSYSIKYRVHVKDIGWMPWVSSGQVAGTTGESRRIEAIQIKVEKKQTTNNNTSNNNSNNTGSVNRLSGIDVSKYQGNIDWAKVKSSGKVDFAMIRTGYRGYTVGNISEDVQFLNNIKGAYNNGIKVGIYFYSSAINETEAIEEANYVLNLINKYGVSNYISYPIVIDVEDFEGTRNYNLTVQERTNIVKAFCNTIKNAGFKPMVYSYTYFLENKLYMDQLTEYDTWIADYYGNTWYKRSFTIWQYTDKGKIDGIVGDVDLNYSYKNY
ncbi:MAG: GH25 family lysozyme [Candidatus Scatovivens sp.]